MLSANSITSFVTALICTLSCIADASKPSYTYIIYIYILYTSHAHTHAKSRELRYDYYIIFSGRRGPMIYCTFYITDALKFH